MSTVAEALEELIALGVQGAALIAAARRIEEATYGEKIKTLEEAVLAASTKADADLAERKAKAAERTRRHRVKKSGNVTSVTVTLADVPERDRDVTKDASAPTCTQVVIPTLPSLRSEELKPLTHPSDASPRKAKSGRSRLVPASWTIPDKVMADLTDQGFSPGEIERELANFRDHEFRDPKTAWDLAFRKWMRTSRNFQPRKAPHERPHHDAKFEARQANLSRAFAGADRAAGRDWKP